MKEYIQENKRTLFILIGLLFVLVIVLYFLLLRPLLADLSSEERQLIALENERDVLMQKISSFNDEVEEVDVEQLIYENKIPTERELDEYILALQQAELMTDSKLLEIEFVYDSSLDVSEVEETETEAEVPAEVEVETITDEEDAQADTEDNEGEEPPTIDPVIINEKPEELQVLTARVTGASKDFDDFIDLIKVIEEQERISIISTLSFNKPTKDDLLFAEDPFIALSFTAELTTFYYPN